MHVTVAGEDTPGWSYGGEGAAFEVAPGGFLTLDRLALHGGVAVDGGSLTVSRSTLDPAVAVSASGGVVAFEDCAVDGAPLTVQVPTPWSGTAGQLAAALAAGLSPTVADPQCFEEATYDAVEAFISHACGPFCRRAGAFAAQPLLGACAVEACEGLCGAADAGCGAACAAMPAALLVAGVTGQQFVAGTAAGAPPPFVVPSACAPCQHTAGIASSRLAARRMHAHLQLFPLRASVIPDQTKGISYSKIVMLTL
jgi:hypothetical protein